MCRCNRRELLVGAGLALAPGSMAVAQPIAPRFIAEAFRMRDLAVEAGDQPYGAIIALGEAIIGFGPSRVVQDRDPDRHAERVAIADAQARIGRASLEGAILVSTSRACADCERAAARAGIAGMFHGRTGQNAGAPVLR